jgi:MarR family transcriptional regulator, lower aerobic nicotinate degradation pathway regulator
MRPQRVKSPKARPKDSLSIVDALVQLSFLVQSVLSQLAAKHDLSIVQVRLLGILRDREPAMMELASFLELDKSSVTGLIDRAERRGLVTRTANAGDRRAVHVALTDRGQNVAEAFATQVTREMATLTEHLGSASRSRLADLASQVIAQDVRRREGDPERMAARNTKASPSKSR